MKENQYVKIGSQIMRALHDNPRRSDVDIAGTLGVSVSVVRRYRALLELSGLLVITDSRIGTDGIVRSI